MPDHKVEIVARDELGSIVALITAHGVVDARTASAEIARGDVCYVTGPDSYVRVPVKAIPETGGAYLYANWEGSQRNNLHDLAPAARVHRLSPAVAAEESRSRGDRGAGPLARLVQGIRMLAWPRQRPALCVDCPPCD